MMENNIDKQYLDLCRDILENGVEKNTRSGKVKSVFGRMLRHDLSEGLPMLTTKKVFGRGCIVELLWFLKGDTNIKYLIENNVHIWDDDAYRHYKDLINRYNEYYKDDMIFDKIKYDIMSKEEFLEAVKNEVRPATHRQLLDKHFNDIDYVCGDLGPVYGKQWRSFGYNDIDQIQNVIDTLKTNPDDRRLLVIAFNPDVLDEVALPPCHILFQFYSKPLPNGKRSLSCMWTQRSVDAPLGWPINILSYSILTHMIAQCCDMEVGEIICSLGDVHIYENQIPGVQEQLTHDPHKYKYPTLWLNPNIKDIDKFTFDDIKILNYESYPKISFPLSVGLEKTVEQRISEKNNAHAVETIADYMSHQSAEFQIVSEQISKTLLNKN